MGFHTKILDTAFSGTDLYHLWCYFLSAEIAVKLREVTSLTIEIVEVHQG